MKGSHNVTKLLFCFAISLVSYIKGFSQLTSLEEELIAPSLSVSPKLDYIVEINMRGLSSTNGGLPFWMHHNQRGRISVDSNISAWLTGKSVIFFTEDSFILTGTTVLYQDGVNEGVIPDELFVHYQNSYLYLTAGRKQRKDLFSGLSATNANILWSLNHRPLPGIQVGTNGPIYLYKTWGPAFQLTWSEYLLGKDRRISDARLHHKTLHFIYRTQNGMEFRAGAQHFGHWNGELPRDRDIGQEVGGYLDAVMLEGNTGTHVTTYEINFNKEFRDFSIEVIYNHFATDRSGRLYENSPDGRYGIFFEQKQKDVLISKLNYEFFYTKNQSFSPETGLSDNYFNYYPYAEGWAYKNKFMGAPFFTYEPENRRVINNKFIAHHVGLAGELNIPFKTNPYRLLLTYVRGYGTYPTPLPAQTEFYSLFEMGILKSPVNLDLQFATEFKNTSSLTLGFGLHLNYRL